MSINRVVLVGRLVADPELRHTQNNIPVTNFCLAVDRPYRNDDGESPTDFINVVAWKNQAESFCKYMQKGRLVGVDGSLQMRRYQTDSGENRTVYEVQANSIQFLGGNHPQNEHEEMDPPKQPQDEASDTSETSKKEEMPF